MKLPKWVWLSLLPVVLGAPFVGRSYFVDDHYHMLMAKGLLEHPARPYDFRADDAGPDNAGWERGQPPRMVNPPLHHYLLALFWEVSGGRLWLVRFLSLWISAGTLAILYWLARRFAVPPEPVVVLAAVTPVFFLSSYALLIDSTLLFLFLGAVWAWIEGLHRRSAGLLAASGVLLGLAFLTKYTAALAAPLMGLYWLMDRDRRRDWRPLAVFLIPLAIYGAWSGWNFATYGADHFFESKKRVMQSFSVAHLLVFFTFLGGIFLTPLAAWRGFSRQTGLVAGLGAAALAFFLFSPWGGFSRGQALLMAFLCASGAAFFVQTGLLAFRSRFPGDRFLWLWLAVGVFQMIYVMQWVAARYYLTLLPPILFLSYRQWQAWLPRARLSAVVGAAVAVMGVFSAVLAAGDYLQAETSRWIVRDVTRDAWLTRGRGFFLGDSFTGSGLKAAGWTSAFVNTPLAKGDLLLQSEIVMPPWWLKSRRLSLRPLARYEYSSRLPLRVMDNGAAAGFYASAWGPLPFAFSRGPLERYTLYQVLEDSPGGALSH